MFLKSAKLPVHRSSFCDGLRMAGHRSAKLCASSGISVPLRQHARSRNFRLNSRMSQFLNWLSCLTSVEDRLAPRSRVCACLDSLRPAKPWNRVYSGLSWLCLTVCGPARVRFCRRSINRASSSISAGLLCLPPLWISSSLCINSAKFSMTSSKAGKAGWQK